MAKKSEPNGPPPLSGKGYVYVALIMFAIGIGLLVLFVVLAPRLIPGGTEDKFYYILLIVWGLISAIVLFGVVRSYARITYRHMAGGIAVELGGAAAFAGLVVVGGYFLVPREPFDLTIRPHGPGVPLITWGKIRVEFSQFAPTIDVNANGEADFKGIPHQFLGAKVRILPKIDGYKAEYQELTIAGNSLDLNLELPETLLKGTVFPMPVGKHVVTVIAEGEVGRPVPVDQYGRFQMVIHKNPDENVRLTVCADGWRVYDDLRPVSGAKIHLRKRDQPCSN